MSQFTFRDFIYPMKISSDFKKRNLMHYIISVNYTHIIYWRNYGYLLFLIKL